MTLQLAAQILSLLVCIVGAALAISTFTRRIVRRYHQRQWMKEHPRPAIYEVGSPEYNAQIVGMVRTLNQRLAERGQRLPERTAIDIIRLTASEDSNHRPESETQQ